MKDLASAVIESIETQKRDFQFLYSLEQGIEQKNRNYRKNSKIIE